ncbi:MAG: cytochrome c peroxidase, partial [Cyanobacteriota bacterium]
FIPGEGCGFVVLKRLEDDSKYKNMFKKAFPNEKQPISYLNLSKSIADFEKTLVTPSKFDKFLKGNIASLNKDEKKGLRTFMEKGCITCHNGVAVGGQMYQKFGLVKPYKNAKDLGRFDLTKNEADKFVFKVPSLRNIAKTAPYFHDGKVKTLSEAVTTMGETQLGIKLSKEENKAIVDFLNSLTGEIKKEFK